MLGGFIVNFTKRFVLLIGLLFTAFIEQSKADQALDGLDLVWPVPSITEENPLFNNHHYAEYGDVSPKRHHAGIDIPAAVGTKVVAAHNGFAIVKSLSQNENKNKCMGNVVLIWDLLIDAYTLYAHLDTINVVDGQIVKAGETQIGTIGTTLGLTALNGSCGSIGPHLHFELKNHGGLGDPGKETWGYTPPKTTPQVGAPTEEFHPNAYGYFDPTLNLHPELQSTIGTQMVTAEGNGVSMRTGPNIRYGRVGEIREGEQYLAINRLDINTQSCSMGWYQLKREDGSYIEDSIDAPADTDPGSLPTVWACRGHNGVDYLLGPSCRNDPTEQYSKESQLSYAITNSGDHVDAKICNSTDVDFYNVSLNQKGTIAASIDPPANKNYSLSIYDSAGVLVESTGETSAGEVNVQVEAGTYTIKILGVDGDFDDQADYRLTAFFGPSCFLIPTPSLKEEATLLQSKTNPCGQPSPPTGVLASDGVFPDKVTISWNSVYGFDTYVVRRCTNLFGTECFIVGETDKGFLIDENVTPGTSHFYSVKACKEENCTEFSESDSGYSQSMIFRAPDLLTNEVSNTKQASAILNSTVSPNGAETLVYFEYGRTANFGYTTSLINIGSSNSSSEVSRKIFPLECDTHYFFRVRASNAYGSGVGGTKTFTTQQCSLSEVPAPNTVDARDGLASNGIFVSWGEIDAASYYKIYRSTSLNGNKVLLSGSFTSSAFADVEVSAGTIYYYWIRACNAQGVCSELSSPDSGFVRSETSNLLAPVNPDPEIGETGVSIRVGDLGWEDGGGANSYQVYFGTDPSPDSGEYIGDAFTNNIGIPDLEYETTYYWRVDSRANGETTTGNVWSFTTRSPSLPDLPGRQVNPTPSHFEDDVLINGAVLRWENGGGAESYDVYFGRASEPDEEEYLGNTQSTSWSLPQLEYDRIYFWRVKGRNAGGAGKGDVWRFSTEPSAPDPVIWPYPNDQVADYQTTNVRLNWTDASRKATSFDVYLGTSPSLGNADLLGNTPSVRSSWQVGSLSRNTTYYWKIVSKNRAGQTSSPTWSFTTWDTSPGILSISDGSFTSFESDSNNFMPSSMDYVIENVGEQALDFSVIPTEGWLSITMPSGTLQPSESKTVSVTFNNNATTLDDGSYYGLIDFKNTTDGRGDDARSINLTKGGTAQSDVYLRKLVTGWAHVLGITQDNRLVGWGGNSQSGSEFGLGIALSPTVVPSPVVIFEGNDWKDVAAGIRNSFAIKEDGSLYGWGLNKVGELGLGDKLPREEPTRIGTDNDWQAVSAGYWHTLALKEDGRLFSFGENDDGMLGHGDRVDRLTPVQVGTDDDWAFISLDAQIQHSMAIKENGQLYIWGRRDLGESNDKLVPTRLGLDSNWKKIMRGGNGDHYIALKSNGEIYSWGDNNRGQLGQGDFLERETPTRIGSDNDWVDIAASGSHSLGLKADGSLFAWGSNNFSQLGLGDIVDRESPTLVMVDPDIVSISGTDQGTLILKNDGSVYSWGGGRNGELGRGYLSFREFTPGRAELNWINDPFINDFDRDGIENEVDNDDDGDGVPDIEDQFPLNPAESRDSDGDELGDNEDADDDNDGRADDEDNCPVTSNPDQADADDDGTGDLCDLDIDGDDTPNVDDNCPFLASSDHTDTDQDNTGDVCDPDADNDGVLNAVDTAPLDPSLCQDVDSDSCNDCAIGMDSFGLLSDFDPSNDGIDTNGDGICDLTDEDDDGDTVLDAVDNCPLVANLDQIDRDRDGIGDICDKTIGPLPDAQIISLGLSTNTQPLNTGDSIFARVRVLNRGSAPFGRQIPVQFFLSTDRNYSSNDLRLASISVPNLAPGQTSSEQIVELKIPNTIRRQVYLLGVKADPNDSLIESNKQNNILWSREFAFVNDHSGKNFFPAIIELILED